MRRDTADRVPAVDGSQEQFEFKGPAKTNFVVFFFFFVCGT